MTYALPIAWFWNVLVLMIAPRSWRATVRGMLKLASGDECMVGTAVAVPGFCRA